MIKYVNIFEKIFESGFHWLFSVDYYVFDGE